MTFTEFHKKNKDLILVPLKNKVPQLKWKDYRQSPASKAELTDWSDKGYEIGILTENIEVIDVDEKQNLSDVSLIKQWSDIVKKTNPKLLDNLLVTSTVNGGWHVIYKAHSC